jgi:hypothetical protein
MLTQNLKKKFSVSCSSGKAVVRRKVKRNAKLIGGKRQGRRVFTETTAGKRGAEVARFGKL